MIRPAFDYQTYTFPRLAPAETRGLDGLLKQEKQRAFLLIDMQPEFTSEPGFDAKRIRNVLAAQERVLKYCARYDCPVLVLEWKGFQRTLPHLCSLLEDIPRRVYVKKERTDGFTNPQVGEQLREWQAHELYFMGTSAAYCVKDTAKQGLKNGFRIATATSVIAWEKLCSAQTVLPWYKRNGVFFSRGNGALI